jgi:PASTA domain
VSIIQKKSIQKKSTLLSTSQLAGLVGIVVALVLVALPPTSAAGQQLETRVISFLGDRDGFGYGLSEGSTGPRSVIFDNRESDDPFFTDVWPVPATITPRLAVFSYKHEFGVPERMSLVGAKLSWFTLGIQDGDRQVFGGDTDLRLFLDGTEVPGAFDTVDQFDLFPAGWSDSAGSVTINVPPGLLPLLADGSVDLRLDTHALGSHDGLDGFAIDFSELTLVFASCRVPKLVGMRLALARREIAMANCKIGRVRRVFSPRREGVVVAQSPPHGTRLAADARVDVIVSKGRRSRR